MLAQRVLKQTSGFTFPPLCDILGVRRDPPLIAKLVFNAAHAVAKGLIGRLTKRLRSRSHGPLINGVDILKV